MIGPPRLKDEGGLAGDLLRAADGDGPAAGSRAAAAAALGLGITAATGTGAATALAHTAGTPTAALAPAATSTLAQTAAGGAATLAPVAKVGLAIKAVVGVTAAIGVGVGVHHVVAKPPVAHVARAPERVAMPTPSSQPSAHAIAPPSAALDAPSAIGAPIVAAPAAPVPPAPIAAPAPPAAPAPIDPPPTTVPPRPAVTRESARPGATMAHVVPQEAHEPSSATGATSEPVETSRTTTEPPPVAPTSPRENAPTPSPQVAAVIAEPSKSVPVPSTLGRETELIDRALTALRHRDLAAATAALDEYDRTFPAGTMAPEAKVARIECLLARGDTAGARALAHEFLAAHASSPLAPRVRGLIR